MVNDGDHYHDMIYGWMEFSCSFTVTDFLRHTTAPFPCRRRVRSSAKKPDNSKTSRFLKKETPFTFVKKLRHDANRTVWSSAGCSYIQIQCVCLHSITSQRVLSVAETASSASSQFHYAQERTHMPPKRAVAAWRGAHGQPR